MVNLIIRDRNENPTKCRTCLLTKLCILHIFVDLFENCMPKWDNNMNMKQVDIQLYRMGWLRIVHRCAQKCMSANNISVCIPVFLFVLFFWLYFAFRSGHSSKSAIALSVSLYLVFFVLFRAVGCTVNDFWH